MPNDPMSTEELRARSEEASEEIARLTLEAEAANVRAGEAVARGEGVPEDWIRSSLHRERAIEAHRFALEWIAETLRSRRQATALAVAKLRHNRLAPLQQELKTVRQKFTTLNAEEARRALKESEKVNADPEYRPQGEPEESERAREDLEARIAEIEQEIESVEAEIAEMSAAA